MSWNARTAERARLRSGDGVARLTSLSSEESLTSLSDVLGELWRLLRCLLGFLDARVDRDLSLRLLACFEARRAFDAPWHRVLCAERCERAGVKLA